MMWDLVVPHVKDVYALEHLFHSILLLESSSSGSTSERGFPKTLGVCLGGSLGVSSDLKLVVLERILLKRILPLRYLRFVLLFLSRGMEEVERAQGIGSLSIEEVLYRVSLAWSKEDSLSAFSLGHQACLSVIIIECLQLTNRDELEQDYPVIPEILSGVSLRLASANVSVRYQGMSVAKALSVVLDPAKPLVFDVKADFEQSLLRDLQEATRGLLAEKRDLQGGDEQDGLQDTKYANSGSGAHSSSRTHVADIHDAVSYGTNNCIYDECEALSLSDESSRESDSDDESSLEAYDMSDDEDDLNAKLPRTVGSLVKALRKPDDHENFEFVLKHCEKIISNVDSSVKAYVGDLVRALLYANVPEEFMEIDKKTRVTPMECKLRGLTASLVKVPLEASRILIADFYSVHLGVSQRLLILDALRLSAIELSGLSPDDDETVLLATSSSSSTTLANPSSSAIDDGDNDGNNKGNAAKTRIFAPVSLSRKGTEPVSVKNRFAPLSAEFMLPLLCKYDHKGEGLNMLGRDFVLLGKLLQTAAIFLKCGGATHQAIELAFTLFEFVASTGVLDHKESFVRKCTLQAIYQIVETIPSFLLVGGQGGSPLNFEGLQELLLCGAKYDRDEECRLLFAQVLHDLHERCTELLPKIQI
jgi:telomere length regulation protein